MGADLCVRVCVCVGTVLFMVVQMRGVCDYGLLFMVVQMCV